MQKEMEVATTYQANGTPSGYLISAEGTIASELAIGAEPLLDLLTRKSKIENQKSEMDPNLPSPTPLLQWRRGRGAAQQSLQGALDGAE